MGTANVNVQLSQAAFSLQTVVTTVTGAQSKAEISNTVATVDVASKIAETPVVSTGQLLSGRAAGVQVVSQGATGAGSRIRIRGQSSLSLSNDPLIYVDGVRVNGQSSAQTSSTGGTTQSALDQIAPEEIESDRRHPRTCGRRTVRHAGRQRRHPDHDEEGQRRFDPLERLH